MIEIRRKKQKNHGDHRQILLLLILILSSCLVLGEESSIIQTSVMVSQLDKLRSDNPRAIIDGGFSTMGHVSSEASNGIQHEMMIKLAKPEKVRCFFI